MGAEIPKSCVNLAFKFSSFMISYSLFVVQSQLIRMPRLELANTSFRITAIPDLGRALFRCTNDVDIGFASSLS